ncbi:MAG: hypothetical protein H6622_14465 [Halobacteriovoraceae bacterium]|nr:hypothetical protein [Halobacteriovoraceae bacterium]
MKKKSILIFILFFSVQHKIFANSYEFMAYNVENLFDLTHDNAKNDWTFLPKDYPEKKEHCLAIKSKFRSKECLSTNWTHEKLEIKLNQIVRVIKSRSAQLPDFLAITEVEGNRPDKPIKDTQNESQGVANMLAKRLGYGNKFLITNGPDQRGIDVALFYKGENAQLVNYQELRLSGNYFERKPTRDVLQVDFLIENKHKLTIFVNHWPSQGNPDQTRVIAATKLKKVIQNLQAQDPERLIILTGDFNTVDDDHPHPFKTVFFPGDFLRDVHHCYMSSDFVSEEWKKRMPRGTYFFYRDMVWNYLDRFFVNENLLDGKGLDIDLESYHIYAPDFITKSFKYRDRQDPAYGTKIMNTPKSYNFGATTSKNAGFSDHFPIYVKFTTDAEKLKKNSMSKCTQLR